MELSRAIFMRNMFDGLYGGPLLLQQRIFCQYDSYDASVKLYCQGSSGDSALGTRVLTLVRDLISSCTVQLWRWWVQQNVLLRDRNKRIDSRSLRVVVLAARVS